jgi:multidrug efflux pump subunit AcrB/outer membrane protein TolC
MNPVRAALRYPQVTLFLSAVVFLLGVYSMVRMPRREDPKITIRTGIVAAVYPGATSQEVEDQVTRKIEEHLFHFEEVRREKTYSTTRNGIVIINVELNKSVTNADQFWSKLRLDLALLKAQELPSGVQGPMVDSDFGDTVAVLIAVHGGSYGYRELKDYARTVEDGVRTLPMVSKIHRIGDQPEAFEVDSSNAQLSQYGVTPFQVIQALQGRNTIAYAGRVSDGNNKVPIQSGGRLHNEADIGQLMVDVSHSTGQPVYIRDLATVHRTYKDPDNYVRFNNEPTILLSVEMHEGNNIDDLGKDLTAKLASIQAGFPPNVKLDLVANQPKMVHERVQDFMREFGIAIIAVILVTIILLPLRVALVAAIAIPTSIAMTFSTLQICHVEIQQVSIAALIIVLGMVVDNAIVIVDNYIELLDHGVPSEEAAERSASEMAIPVLAATFAIIAAFAPMLWLSGATGEFIRALPVTVALSLTISYLVAMFLTPMMSKFFIRKGLNEESHGEHGASEVHQKPTMLDHMQKGYNVLIGWAMQHKKATLTGTVLAFVAGVGLLSIVPQHLFPMAEREQFIIDVWLPEGTRIETTDATTRRIEAVLAHESLVKEYASYLGSSFPRFYYNVNPQLPATNYAQILVNTNDVKKTPGLVERLRHTLRETAPEATVIVKECQQGDSMESPVEVRISGPDAATLESIGNNVQDVLRHTPGATYINTDWHEEVLEAGVHVREEVANRLGLSNQIISQELAAGFEGLPATTAWEGDRDLDVLLRLDPAQRDNFRSVKDMYVTSPVTGTRVPVDAVATLSPEWQPGRIVRRNGVRTLTVRAFPAQGQLASNILKQTRKQVDAMPLPPGYKIAYGGEFELQEETFGEMKYVLAAAIMLIFLILLIQFRTLLDPLLIMTALPLAVPGAALGLFITRNTFGFTAFIGLISVGGLVVRNAIILTDYIHQRMKDGVPLEQAALEAGERRLRPIFLTSMAAAVGVVPMILSGSSMWSPMASVIAFGLVGSMVFTLVANPVLFVVAYEKKRTGNPATVAPLLVLLLLFTAPSQAQSRPITLDEAILLASKQNSLVKMAGDKTKEADARVTQARSNYFPVVTNQSAVTHFNQSEFLAISKGALGSYGATGPIPNNDVNIKAGKQDAFITTTVAAQPITQMFKIHAGVSVARADAASAHSDYQQARNEISLNVKTLFYQLLSTQRRKHALEVRIQAGEQALDEARSGVESGVVLQAKVLEGEAQLATARHALGSVEDALDDMSIQFNDLIGLPLNTSFSLVEPGEDKELSDVGAFTATPNLVQDLQSEALAHNPTLQSARYTLDKSRAGLHAARAEYIPDVTGFAQNIHQNGTPLLPTDTELVGFRSEFTISEFGKRIGLVRERHAQMSEAKENVHHAENQVRIEIEKELRKLNRTQDELDAARRQVKAATENFRIIGDQVHSSTANISALREAEARLAEAEAQFFDARKGRVIAQAELEHTLGRQ